MRENTRFDKVVDVLITVMLGLSLPLIILCMTLLRGVWAFYIFTGVMMLIGAVACFACALRKMKTAENLALCLLFFISGALCIFNGM